VAGILNANEEHERYEGKVVMTYKNVGRSYERKENPKAPFASPHQDEEPPTLMGGTVFCWFPCLVFLGFFACFSYSCFLPS
jgi:hypothetical protein